MDNKFGMEQQETEEDLNKEKVFGCKFFVIVDVKFSSYTVHSISQITELLMLVARDIRRDTVAVGATSHASDALAWSYMPSGSMSTRIRKKRKSS